MGTPFVPVREKPKAATRILTVLLPLAACAPLATQEPRAGRSSLGCMQSAIAHIDFSQLPDEQAHCIAAGTIARRCSVSEAMMASAGKEIQDTLGRGDASTRDLRADRRGIDCARRAASEAELSACCVMSDPSVR